MSARLFAGLVVAFLYNSLGARLPSRTLRRAYLRLWLQRLGRGTGVQLGWRFLNGSKVSLGANNVVNFGSLIDGRRFRVATGANVPIVAGNPARCIGTRSRDLRYKLELVRG